MLEAIDARLPVPSAAVAEGLGQALWPGRLDLRRLPDGREALLDAAHNVDGATALASFLSSQSDMKGPLVFAAMRDKDAAGMLRALAPIMSEIVVTQASSARSADPDELAALARAAAPGLPVSVHPGIGAALDAAWRRSRRITVAGSIFLLGDVIKMLGWT
jgi:dihydrofolate synthase/folylpolyglutamate synthase